MAEAGMCTWPHKRRSHPAKDMSDDDRPLLRYRAFPVEDTGEDYDLDLPPTTANEYLRRVQMEASNCPDVVVANLDTSKFLGKQTVTFTDKIAKRKALLKKNNERSPVRLPKIGEKDQWKAICCGSTSSCVHPLVSIVTTISQQKIEAIISYNTQWIEEDGFCANMGKWIYALLACVEKPLHPDICSNIRALARACAAARRKLASKDDPNLAPLNLIICLIASYFSQTDLADK
ncbi:gemin 2 isoform X4 [Amblyomma americanum]